MAPSNLNILLIDGTTTVTIPIPAASSIASDNEVVPQGLVSAIVKLGGFWDATQTTWRPLSQIKSITYS